MKNSVDHEKYDTLIQPTDWRYSAACLGLIKFLKHFGFEHEIVEECKEICKNAVYGFGGILYNSSYLTEENYLLFAESYFKEYDLMPHIIILNKLNAKDSSDEWTDEEIKFVNKQIKNLKLSQNYKNLEFDGKNKDLIIDTISSNRIDIIRNNPKVKGQHKNFCKDKPIFYSENQYCRLNGYWVDYNRKSNSLGFCFSNKSYDYNDVIEFDFIPFAFSNPDMNERYFVNNNYSINILESTNDNFSKNLRNTDKKKSPKSRMLKVLEQADAFINYDVEIIVKDRDNDYYNTLFVRAERLKALQELKDVYLNFKYYITNDYCLDLEKEVKERCLNGLFLDDIIQRMLKIYFEDNDAKKYKISPSYVQYNTNILILLNTQWKGDINMPNEQVKKDIVTEVRYAFSAGRKVSTKLMNMGATKKINSFRVKLGSAITANDYVRVCDIMMNLSNYTGIVFPFLLDFYENPEENENVIYAFINNLMEYEPKKKEDFNK